MVEGIWNKIILWALLILFAIIFIFAFYSKTGLISKIANLAFGAERFLPNVPGKDVKPYEELPESVTSTQKAFMGDISKNLDKEKCLLTFNSISGLDNFRMALSNYNGKIISRIETVSGKERAIKLNSVETDKLQVCIINPEGFYDCYLGANKGECKKPLYNELSSVEITKDSIILSENTYNLAESLLFKPEKGKVCLIPVSGSLVGCTQNSNTISNSCLKIMKSEIPECGKQLESTINEEMKKDPKEEFERYINFLNGISSESYGKLCRKNFLFDTKKIKSKFYIYAYTGGRIELKYNNEGVGELIDASNVKYIPYGMLSSASELNTYFSQYGSFSDNYLIAPAGDSAATDISGALITDSAIVYVNNQDKWILTNSNLYIATLPICK